jgi:hypothetical protein
MAQLIAYGFIILLFFFPMIYGVISAAHVSIVLAILAFFLPPTATIFGWCAILGHAGFILTVAKFLHLA